MPEVACGATHPICSGADYCGTVSSGMQMPLQMSSAEYVHYSSNLWSREVLRRSLSVVVEAHNLMAEEAARRRVRMNVAYRGRPPFVVLDRVQIQQGLCLTSSATASMR